MAASVSFFHQIDWLLLLCSEGWNTLHRTEWGNNTQSVSLTDHPHPRVVVRFAFSSAASLIALKGSTRLGQWGVAGDLVMIFGF